SHRLNFLRPNSQLKAQPFSQLSTSSVVPRPLRRSRPTTSFPSLPASSTQTVRKTHRHNRDHVVRAPARDTRTARRQCSSRLPPPARIRLTLTNSRGRKLITSGAYCRLG